MLRVTSTRLIIPASRGVRSGLPCVPTLQAQASRYRAHRDVSTTASRRSATDATSSSASASQIFHVSRAGAEPRIDQTTGTQFEPEPSLPMAGMDEKKVRVGWDPLTWSRYQHVWLRDHCRCPECFHQVTKQRLLDTFAITPDIQPSRVESTPEGLRVTWPSSEQHISTYPWDWLRRNSYDPSLPDQKAKLPARQREKVLWSAKITQDPPTVEFEHVMNDEKSLYKWLKKIDVFGFCFVSGVPVTPEATEELSRKLGFIRKTHYGEFWDFTADMAKGDTAYTTMTLQAHTDSTYFTDPCGLQLFHLLSHTDGSGGASLLVDGFYVASILRELHPDAFRILSTVRVPTHAAGEKGVLYRPIPAEGYPILSVREDGELLQVRYNNDDRSVMRGVGPEALEEWYAALRLWNKHLKSADSEYWVQLAPGTAVVVDNHRVLHGRSAFDGKRRMCGAYIGMDEFCSNLTVLSEKYAEGASGPASDVNEKPGGRDVWSPYF